MTARPSAALSWATNANYSTGPQAGQPTKVALDAGLLADGAIRGVKPAPQKYNYLFSQIAQWQQYTDEVACLTKTASAALVANTNNLNGGTDFYAGATELLVTASAAFDLTGLVAPASGALMRRIRNRGANPITLKHQSASSTAANRFVISTGTDFVLSAGTAVWIAYDVTDTRWVVQVAGTGGGGAGTLFATLSAGPSAGGLNITDVGYFASQGELTVKQNTEDILRTASGTTILRSTAAAIVLRKAANDIAQFNQGSGQTEMLFAAGQPLVLLGALAPSSGHGVKVRLVAGAPGGVGPKDGGRFELGGTAPIGLGAAGGGDILSTTGAVTVAFNDTLVTYSIPVSLGNNRLQSVGAPIASTDAANRAYVDAIPSVAVQAALAASSTATSFNGQDVSGVDDLTANRLILNGVGAVAELSGSLFFGNSAFSSVQMRASTIWNVQVGGGSPQLSVRSTYVGLNVPMQFEQSVSASSAYYTQVAPAAGVDGHTVSFLGQAAGSGAAVRGGRPRLANGTPGASAIRDGAAMGLLSNGGGFEPMVECAEVGAGKRLTALGPHTAIGAETDPGDMVFQVPVGGAFGSSNPPSGQLYARFTATTIQIKDSAGTVTTIS